MLIEELNCVQLEQVKLLNLVPNLLHLLVHRRTYESRKWLLIKAHALVYYIVVNLFKGEVELEFIR